METIRLKQIFLFLFLMFALSNSAFAYIVDNLYTVVIQVTDNTVATRNQQLPKAFEQVIKRVSSSYNVLNHPEYEAARQHLDRFVSHYAYADNGNNNFTLTMR